MTTPRTVVRPCLTCDGAGKHYDTGRTCFICDGNGTVRRTATAADVKRHGDVAEPGPCGDCKDVRTAAKARPPLTLVGQMQRCLVHDESYVSVCRGCAADRLAGEAS